MHNERHEHERELKMNAIERKIKRIMKFISLWKSNFCALRTKKKKKRRTGVHMKGFNFIGICQTEKKLQISVKFNEKWLSTKEVFFLLFFLFFWSTFSSSDNELLLFNLNEKQRIVFIVLFQFYFNLMGNPFGFGIKMKKNEHWNTISSGRCNMLHEIRLS